MKLLNILIFVWVFLFLSIQKSLATYNPLTKINNRVGVHIFSPDEIDQVAELVNSNGGEWGYVTVPIREDQLDWGIWQRFMKKSYNYKLIPILRLATKMTSKGWNKPVQYTNLDFANFLNTLDWPVKNRYIIIYNEPNHATEWGGEVKPDEYADVLQDAADIFKKRNSDFYILPAGLDVAAPNDNKHMRWDDFLNQMNKHNPEALTSIDAWNSHSYPNPAFSGSVYDQSEDSIMSFKYEKALVDKLTGKDLTIFITETGWSNQRLTNLKIASYFKVAFSKVWNQNNIVAVTPFILRAHTGEFAKFSLLSKQDFPLPQYQAIYNLKKSKGEPELNPQPEITFPPTPALKPASTLRPIHDQEFQLPKNKWFEILNWIKNLFR